MAYAMTKQGSLDNCVTYEFICDTITDMNAIENRYRTIGSVAVVLQGESDGLEVYIAGSDKQWNNLGSMGASNSQGGSSGLSIYICAQNEVSNGLPDISEPDESTIYLVPAGNTSGNLYEEYIYANNAWEKFGSGGNSIDLSNYVQKTDIATQSTAGLVKVLDNGNVTFNEHNQLVLTLAGTAVVKSGQSDHPISVTHQHEAAFYGLAKAAGQDMKNSNNAVGTYTDDAKAAIRTMIGAGTGSVSDIQMNGTSILNNGVANIPYATDSSYGVIQPGNGLTIRNNQLILSSASETAIKAGIETRQALVPARTNAIAFYGLAKAAGDETQAASDNAVGTYTDSAKTAIRTMIGAGTYTKPNDGIPAADLANTYLIGTQTLELGNLLTNTGNGVTNATLSQDYTTNFESLKDKQITLFINEDEYSITLTKSTDERPYGPYTIYVTIFSSNETNSENHPIFTYEHSAYDGYDSTTDICTICLDTEYNNPAVKLQYKGDIRFNYPQMYINCNDDGTGGTKVATLSDISGKANSTDLNNYVAKTDYATAQIAGIIKTNADYGLGQLNATNYTGTVSIKKASQADIKTGTNQYKPIVPDSQHSAVFYGLAKAAGDSTQNASDNAVGIYTDDAKVKIQKMLGIYEPPYELVNDITLQEESDLELTTTDNNVAYNFRNVFIIIDYPANLTSVTTGYSRYRFLDTNNTYTAAETGKYVTNSSNCFKYIWTKREGNMAITFSTGQTTTGSAGGWRSKSFSSYGISFNLENITKIDTFSDVEPAGTRIRIYAQWAY